MKTEKTILIVVDEAESIQKVAQEIVSHLNGNRVLLRSASQFNPTDLLAADICFFGCETPHPVSFAALEKVLLHINLAGRPCGLFSPGSEKAASYLKKMVKDSELSLVTEPLLGGQPKEIKTWIKTVIQGH